MNDRVCLEDENWDLTIKPKRRFFQFDLKELLEYKFLMFLFVRRDFVVQFKQTILGPLWFILQSVLTSGIYTLIFSSVAKIPTDGIPPFLFNMAGVTLWNYFSSCLSATSASLVTNAGLFGKIYFPRMTVPISAIITRLYSFLIQLIIFVLVLTIMKMKGAALYPNISLLLLPLLIAHAGLLGLGIGLISSALTVKYRDLNNLVGLGLSLWMWATPIVYPMSFIPHSLKFIAKINPVSPLVEIFRYSATGAGSFPLTEYVISIGATIVLLFLGIALFHRAEQNFIDVV